jgi:hypothetical protein
MVIDRPLGRIAGVTFVGRPPGIVFHSHFRGSEFGADFCAELSTTTTRPCCLAKTGHLRTSPVPVSGFPIVPRSTGSLYGVLNQRQRQTPLSSGHSTAVSPSQSVKHCPACCRTEYVPRKQGRFHPRLLRCPPWTQHAVSTTTAYRSKNDYVKPQSVIVHLVSR